MFPVLQTDRLILRQITPLDVEAIFTYLSDDNVTRYYGSETLETFEQASDLIRLFTANWEEKKGIRWGIERIGEEGVLIGTIGFHAWSSKHKRAEIGYGLHPDHWRKGYMSEAIAEVLTYGSEALGFTRIGAIVFMENAASIQLLTKVGFQQEGVLRNYIYHNGVSYSTYIYSFLPKG